MWPLALGLVAGHAGTAPHPIDLDMNLCWSSDSSAAAALRTPEAWCEKEGYERVMMADFPSTGSTWLRELLGYAAKAKGVPSPSCAVYESEHHEHCASRPGLYCEAGPGVCDGTLPKAALVKTHFPSNQNFNDLQLLNMSSCYQRLLVLVRQPLSLMNSNWHRGWPSDIGQLDCWTRWWAEQAQRLDPSKLLVVRYEDLCLETLPTLAKVLKFLGTPALTDQELTAALTDAPKCKYTKEDLGHMGTPLTAAEEYITETRYAKAWGYKAKQMPPAAAASEAAAARWEKMNGGKASFSALESKLRAIEAGTAAVAAGGTPLQADPGHAAQELAVVEARGALQQRLVQQQAQDAELWRRDAEAEARLQAVGSSSKQFATPHLVTAKELAVHAADAPQLRLGRA